MRIIRHVVRQSQLLAICSNSSHSPIGATCIQGDLQPFIKYVATRDTPWNHCEWPVPDR